MKENSKVQGKVKRDCFYLFNTKNIITLGKMTQNIPHTNLYFNIETAGMSEKRSFLCIQYRQRCF